MNTKRKMDKRKSERSTGNKIISMLLLLFISITGLYISGNMICYIGILYASVKIVILLRPSIKRISKENNLSPGFKITFVVMFISLIMLFIGIYNMIGLPPDYTKITMVPQSNIYSHDLWKIKDIVIIQNHPIIFFVVAVIMSIVGLFTIMITKFKNELIMVQNIIEKKTKEILNEHT